MEKHRQPQAYILGFLLHSRTMIDSNASNINLDNSIGMNDSAAPETKISTQSDPLAKCTKVDNTTAAAASLLVGMDHGRGHEIGLCLQKMRLRLHPDGWIELSRVDFPKVQDVEPRT